MYFSIHQLILAHGDEAKSFMISCLLDEIDLRDQSSLQQKVCFAMLISSYLPLTAFFPFTNSTAYGFAGRANKCREVP